MTSNYGGIESFIMNLYRNIDHNKFQFDFINMELNNRPIAYSEEIKNLGGKIYNIPVRKENILANRKALKEILVNNNYDVVANNVLTWSYGEGIFLPLKYSNAKVIVHSHNGGMNNTLISRRIMNIWNRRYNLNNNIIRLACSQVAGKWLFHNRKFQVILNGINTVKYKFDSKIRFEYRNKFELKDKKVFLHVGRFSYQKNHKYVIKLFEALLKRNPNSVLFLVGDGELKRNIEEYVNALGLNRKVLFLGTRHDVKNLMYMSDCLLFPSFYEGFPMVLIESQATGLPCIISNKISSETKITDLIQFIDINKNPEKYTEHIFKILDKKRKREKYTSLVRNHGYDIQYTVNELEKIYENED